METIVLKVNGMSCGHCTKAVEDAIGALNGIESVEVSLEAGTATVIFDPALANIASMKTQIEDQGYDVE